MFGHFRCAEHPDETRQQPAGDYFGGPAGQGHVGRDTAPALSTVALTATASYLAAHHAGRLAPAEAAVHGYTVAFTISAALFGVGALVALLLIPSRRRLEELRNAALAASTASAASPSPADGVSAGDEVRAAGEFQTGM